MKDQVPLSAAGLKDEFEKALTATRDTFGKNGTDAVLRHISDSVRALQEAGGALGITVRGGAHTNAYDMMYTVSGTGGGTIDAYGFIRSGESVRLFALASVHGEKKVCRLYLSDNNVAEEGGRISTGSGAKSQTNIVGQCFDFDEDPEALQKFQKKLAAVCAENAVVLENDSSRVFNREPALGDTLQKTVSKLHR